MQINKNIVGKHQYTLPYASKYKYKLDVIENFWPIHPDIKQAIDVALDDKIHQYPYHDDIYYELLDHISSYTNVPTSDIILTNGSDSALKLIIDGYVTPDTNTLIITPTYPHFISFIENIYHGDIDYLNIDLFDSNVDIINKISNKLSTKQYNLCYICSPNLPLGYTLDHSNIIQLLNNYLNTMFIIDEAYFEYPPLDQIVPSASHLIKHHNNICVTRTFSKAFGLASLRLGYLLSNNDTINLLRVLSNDKNVTTVAIYAGNSALRNLDYYKKCINEVQELKKQVASELNSIISSNDEIYGYNMSGGNFFLLFAKNPAKVVEIFKEHYIFIRNKHDDVPNAIRVTMGTETMMKDVLLLCKFINIKSQLLSNKIIFDLDMTLRNGSKLTSPAFENITFLNKLDYYICTSNGSQSIDQIYNWFIDKDVLVQKSQIINPIIMVYNYINLKKFKNVLIVSPKEVTDELASLLPDINIQNVFNNKNEDQKFDLVVYTGSPILDVNQLINVCENLHNGAILAYTDQGMSCDLDNFADTDKIGSTIIPDIGSYMTMFKSTGYESINIGKPVFIDYTNLGSNNIKYVIGDSIRSDSAVSAKLNSIFILVSQDCGKPFVDFDNDRIVISCISDILN